MLLHRSLDFSGEMGIQGKGDKLQLPFQMNSGNCVKKFKSMLSVVDRQGAEKAACVLQASICGLQFCIVCFALLCFACFAPREEGPTRGKAEGEGKGTLDRTHVTKTISISCCSVCPSPSLLSFLEGWAGAPGQ